MKMNHAVIWEKSGAGRELASSRTQRQEPEEHIRGKTKTPVWLDRSERRAVW